MVYTVMFKVEFLGDVKVTANAGDNILDLAPKAGIGIDAPCSGNGTCGKCRVKIIAGTVERCV